jgi:hypothetical protein
MAQNSEKFICYYRVSTARQGRSGLGLEAQQAAVRRYLNGGAWEIAAEFTEIESGRNSSRPVLERALAAARLHRATLYGIAVALSVTGHSDMMTTALPVPIQAPGFNMGTGPAHGPNELVTMRHVAAEAKVGDAQAKWLQARERLVKDVDANVDDLIGPQFQYESDRYL